jgi:hypothetical protein
MKAIADRPTPIHRRTEERTPVSNVIDIVSGGERTSGSALESSHQHSPAELCLRGHRSQTMNRRIESRSYRLRCSCACGISFRQRHKVDAGEKDRARPCEIVLRMYRPGGRHLAKPIGQQHLAILRSDHQQAVRGCLLVTVQQLQTHLLCSCLGRGQSRRSRKGYGRRQACMECA